MVLAAPPNCTCWAIDPVPREPCVEAYTASTHTSKLPTLCSAHACRHATVDDEHLSRDRLRLAECDHLRSDVLRACHPPKHHLLAGALDDRFRKALRHTAAFY